LALTGLEVDQVGLLLLEEVDVVIEGAIRSRVFQNFFKDGGTFAVTIVGEMTAD
jgi:hypothetical protein